MRFLFVLAVSSVLVAGCVSAVGGHGTHRPAEAPGLPRDGVVVSIRDYPGFVPAVYAFRAVPSVVIAADGTAVRAVASTAGQDRAMPGFRSSQAGRDAVRRLLASAAELGLLGVELDFGSPAVSDLGGTTVEFRLPRRTIDQTAVDAPPGTGLFLTPTERDRRQRLARFRTLAESLVGDDAALYRSPAVAVRRTAAQTPRAATTVPWPLRAAHFRSPVAAGSIPGRMPSGAGHRGEGLHRSVLGQRTHPHIPVLPTGPARFDGLQLRRQTPE